MPVSYTHLLVRREALDGAVIRLWHRRAFGGKGAHGRGLDGVRLHVAHDAQEHVRGRVKGPVAVREYLGRDLRYALHSADDAVAHGAVLIEAAHEPVVHGVAGVVFRHAYLLADDALLLEHALGGEIRRGDELEQRVEILLKAVGALEVIGGYEVRGVGVRLRAARGEDAQRVAPGHVEHLMLEEVRLSLIHI